MDNNCEDNVAPCLDANGWDFDTPFQDMTGWDLVPPCRVKQGSLYSLPGYQWFGFGPSWTEDQELALVTLIGYQCCHLTTLCLEATCLNRVFLCLDTHGCCSVFRCLDNKGWDLVTPNQ
jgi:hypothetical protein